MAEATVKSFPLPAVLGIVTARLWGPFGDIHECAEHVMGHPIWPHEFASVPLWDEMRRRVLLAHPGLADVSPDVYPTSQENLAERLAPWAARFGETLALPKGTTERTRSPLDTLAAMLAADDAEVIVISTPTPPPTE